MTLPGMEQLLAQAGQLARQMQQAQEQFARQTFSAGAGGGMVEATVDGRGRVLEVKLEAELLEEKDRSLLEDLVTAAVNAALDKYRQARRQQLGGAAGGMVPPGLEWLLEMLPGQPPR